MSHISTEIPQPLPVGLLAGLAAGRPLTVFLDYDGTISEITPDIAHAKPVEGARDLIRAMAARPDRFEVVIISGRSVATLMDLLGATEGITLVGNHGLEIIESGSKERMLVDPAPFISALNDVRTWMIKHVPPASGLIIEDKQFSVAIHYRLAEPEVAGDIRQRLAEFIKDHTPALMLSDGKMVVEARPHNVNKGQAVRLLMFNRAARLPVYFGDDVTDEDAFYVLRESGVTVKVSAQPLATWAKYRVSAPRDVVAVLAEILGSPASIGLD
jgi:trehalose 6-phosphate phosphatase